MSALLSYRFAIPALVLAVALVGPVMAQGSSTAKRLDAAQANTGPAWKSLTAQQRATLAPLQNDWSSLDASRKSKWIEIAGRYPSLPAEERRRLDERMAEWSRLSPAQRRHARTTFQEAKRLPSEERQAQWEAYQALPEGQRNALAARAKDAPPTAAPSATNKPPPIQQSKRNTVANPSQAAGPAKAVSPSVVQASPGATTKLVTQKPAPPVHQQAGMPKIAATPVFVDRTTLLPKRGPQGAAMRAAAPSSAPTDAQ